MKYKFILVIIFLCNYIIVLCQHSFQKEIHSEYSYTNSKVYTFNDYYFLTANRFDTNQNSVSNHSPIIFKLNKSGDLIDSLMWTNPLQNAFFDELIYLGNGEIGLIGTAEMIDNPGYYEMFYLKIDEQLNIINQYFYNLGTGYMDYTYAFINSYNNISLASAVQGNPPNIGFQYMDKLLLEITQNGEIVFDSIYNHTALDLVFDFIPYPNTSEYILFCSNGFGKSGEINRLDSNYNLLNSYTTEDDATVGSIIKTEDNNFISSAYIITNSQPEAWLPTFRKYNASLEEINYVEFGSADTASWPALYNSISSIDYSNFYGGYTFNIDKHTLYSSEQSYFSIYAIDKDLNLNWHKLYGGDAYYRLCDIATDSDEGCLITGTKYKNGSTGPAIASLIILKTDENGLITSTTEQPNIPVKNAIITPNPGKDYMQLHSGIFPATLQLFNINGQLVLEEKIYQSTTTINTQSLSSGNYVWQLMRDGKVVQSDKWVKK